MGLAFSAFFPHLLPWSKPDDLKVLLVGLDFVGKTALLHTFPPSDPNVVTQTIATKGYNTRRVIHGGTSIMLWDLSGCHGLRPHWRFYFDNVHAVLFVVDPTDQARIQEAHSELERLALHEPQLSNARFALLLHKADLDADAQVSRDTLAVFEQFMRPRTSSKPWMVEHTSCKTAEGAAALKRVLDWLVDEGRREQ